MKCKLLAISFLVNMVTLILLFKVVLVDYERVINLENRVLSIEANCDPIICE